MTLPTSLDPRKDTLHIIGIGGIGMSALAQAFRQKGFCVQGSDLYQNSLTEAFRQAGMTVFYGHAAAHIRHATVLIISSAVSPQNEEYQEARRIGLPVLSRAEALEILIAETRNIAVAGTHGKTTTTALSGFLLQALGQDPTIFGGGIMYDFAANVRIGKGPWTVIEADESDGTFLSIPAAIAVITNIDAEHLSFYGSAAAMEDAFRRFARKVWAAGGQMILCCDHPLCKALSLQPEGAILTYGFAPDADIAAARFRPQSGGSLFDLHLAAAGDRQPSVVRDVFVPLFGQHNVQNTLAALAVCAACGLDVGAAAAALGRFKGVARRFNILSTTPKGGRIVDDYGHHPTEITATLKAAGALKPKRLIGVIQPHRYSRLTDCFDAFVEAAASLDQVYILPVYAAGESRDGRRESADLFFALAAHGAAFLLADEAELDARLLENLRQEDTVVFLGAGDISAMSRRLSLKLPKPWQNALSPKDTDKERGHGS